MAILLIDFKSGTQKLVVDVLNRRPTSPQAIKQRVIMRVTEITDDGGYPPIARVGETLRPVLPGKNLHLIE